MCQVSVISVTRRAKSASEGEGLADVGPELVEVGGGLAGDGEVVLGTGRAVHPELATADLDQLWTYVRESLSL